MGVKTFPLPWAQPPSLLPSLDSWAPSSPSNHSPQDVPDSVSPLPKIQMGKLRHCTDRYVLMVSTGGRNEAVSGAQAGLSWLSVQKGREDSTRAWCWD